MCGIAGFIHGDGRPASEASLRSMAEAMRHRGPDGEGVYVDGATGLAHRRLSIIDLSEAGAQPMRSSCGRHVITYNGEIYNYRELRTALESEGCRFASMTDTEVLLNGFAVWGEHILDRLNGMFAFAIWTPETKELFLARDRYGIKPLYYQQEGSTFAFASEVKSLLARGENGLRLDREGLMEYFTFQNFFTDRTLFQGVRLLPAGSSLRVGADGMSRGIRQYWDFQFEEPTAVGDEREYEEELERLFCQAVKRQLVSDVEVGSYLSGGMDSGSITAVAATELPHLKTFTCGFDLHSASGLELAYDERERAEYMSYLFKTEHYEMVLKAGDMERCLPQFAWHLEEPRVGQSYPNYYVASLASKFVKVVLSGAGGDELFGGYPWRYYRAVVNDDFEHYIDKYYGFWQRLIPNKALREVFDPIWKDVEHVWTRDVFRDVFQRHAERLDRPEDYVNHSLYFEAKTFLNGLLVVEDKLSMAHSLETRVPFLDNDLVEFAMKLPVSLKLGNLTEVVRLNENEPGNKTKRYFSKTQDGKLLLRKVMERHIPDKITSAVKQGFSSPDASWFRGESIDYVKKELQDRENGIYQFMDYEALQRLVGEHLSGEQNRRLLVWSLLNFSQFLRQFPSTAFGA